jgi:hypothetical protein
MILRRAWIDIVFMLAITGLLVAGMRGFRGYFPSVMGLAFLYLLLMAVRFFKRKRSGP